MVKPIDESRIMHLNAKIRILWALSAVLFAFFIWVIATVIAQLAFPDGLLGASSGLYPFMFLMAIGIFMVPYLVWVELRYRNYTYYIAETEMIIRKGVLRIERTTIPFEKVQNVNVSRSVPERILGLATLKIETAGTNPGEAEGVIPGVGSYRDVVDEILERVEHSRASVSRPPLEPPKQAPQENAGEMMKEMSALREELRRLREEREALSHQREHKEGTQAGEAEAPRKEEAAGKEKEEPAGEKLEFEKEEGEGMEFEGDRYKKGAEKKVKPRNSKKQPKE